MIVRVPRAERHRHPTPTGHRRPDGRCRPPRARAPRLHVTIPRAHVHHAHGVTPAWPALRDPRNPPPRSHSQRPHQRIFSACFSFCWVSYLERNLIKKMEEEKAPAGEGKTWSWSVCVFVAINNSGVGPAQAGIRGGRPGESLSKLINGGRRILSCFAAASACARQLGN